MMDASTDSKGEGHAPQRLLVAGGFLFLAVLGIRWIANTLVWLHLTTGRFVAEHGIPRTDTLSFTADGSPWIAATWLYDRVLYALWGLGAPVVILVHVGLVLGAFALLIGRTRGWACGASIALGLTVSGWLLAPQFTVSPIVAAIALTAVFMFALARPLPAPALWPVLLVGQILWTNMHPSFFFGPIICVVFAVEASRRSPDDDLAAPEGGLLASRTAWSLAIATAAATLLNPYGPKLHVHIIGLLSDPTFLISREWISPFSSQFKSIAASNMLNLGLVIGAGGLVTYRQKLPLAATTLAALGALAAVRNGLSIFLFAILAFPFFCLSIQATGQRICRTREGAARPVWDARIAPFLAIVAIVVSIGGVVTNHYYRAVGSAAAFGLKTNMDMVPSEADAILSHADFPVVAMNMIGDGGYLMWAYPDRKVFVDARPGVYSQDHIQLLGRSMTGDPAAWQEVIDAWGIEAVILNGTQPRAGLMLRAVLSIPGWTLAYLDGSTAIALHQSPRVANLLDNTDIRSHGLDIMEQERQSYRQRAEGLFGAPVSARLIGAAGILYSLELIRPAYAAYDLIVLNTPGMVTAWLPLGHCQFQLGEEAALASLTRASKLNKDNAAVWLALSEALKAQGQTAKAEKARIRAMQLRPDLATSGGAE